MYSRSALVVASLFGSLILSGCQTLTETPQSTAEQETVTDPVTAKPPQEDLTPATATVQPALPATSDTNPEPQDLLQQTRQQLALPAHLDQPRVQSQLNWYRKHPKYLHRVLERARPYYHYILSQTQQRGLPVELALLPIVESAYDPFAYSHGRAAGAWQFIPSTAKHFGLKKTWWYDGRRDIIDSTDAALNYLTQLNKRFDGDWLLALASYNAGGGNVSRAIRRNKAKGKATDFWSLHLPKETMHYVPKLLAVAEMLRNHEQYGLSLPTLPDKPQFEVVETDSQIDLAWAAELTGISTRELYLLNPGFNRWATDPQGPHRLLVPADNADQLRTGLAETPAEKRVKWQRYTIRRGDSLISIAQRFKTTVAVLRKSNSLSSNRIRAGSTLLIPTASQQSSEYVLSEVERHRSKQDRLAANSETRQYYQVRSGDSFWKISRKYNVGVRQLARWNNMAPGDPLRPGQKLLILSGKTSTAKSSDIRSKNRKIGYRVRKGDSLHSIAGRYNLSVADILHWNQLDKSRYLQPGQQLTLYIDVRKAR